MSQEQETEYIKGFDKGIRKGNEECKELIKDLIDAVIDLKQEALGFANKNNVVTLTSELRAQIEVLLEVKRLLK